MKKENFVCWCCESSDFRNGSEEYKVCHRCLVEGMAFWSACSSQEGLKQYMYNIDEANREMQNQIIKKWLKRFLGISKKFSEKINGCSIL